MDGSTIVHARAFKGSSLTTSTCVPKFIILHHKLHADHDGAPQTYTRSDNLLSKTDNLALAQLFVTHAHSLGLSVAQKNTAELGTSGRDVAGFDFAIAEECQEFDECDQYSDVYGAQMLEIEYSQAQFDKACATGRGGKISVVFKDVDVVAEGEEGYKYSEC